MAACPADEMGTGYEYLIGQFADDAGHTAQEFYTNRTVVELMAEILQLQPHESIYDPTCGSGGMLIKSLTYLKEKGEEWRDVKVFGQEINAGTSAIARMNLYLHGIHDFSIVNDDTLQRPAFIKNGRVQQFDVVLANPPYSIKQWNREAFEHDRYGRNFLGTPPQARADYAFIQHIIASMDEKNGRCAILLPHGVLNRKEESELRKNHIELDDIDAIIGLGRNLFFNSGLESFILICSNRKPIERKGKILFIEAENYTHKEGKQSYLYPDDIAKIVHAYNNLEDEEGFSKWVRNEDIEDGNLNIKLYVKSDNKQSSSLDDNLIEYKSQQNSLADALGQFELLDSFPNKIEINNFDCSIDTSSWKKVRLGDVAHEYSARIDNPSESQYKFYIGSDCIGQYDFRIHKKSPANIVTSAQKEFKEGDYLLVRRSLYGSDFRERVPRADFSGCCSADILTIRENPEFISDGYLIYVLYSRRLWDFIVSNSSGGLTRRIKWKQLEDFEFLLPPKDEQKVLAEKLWAAYEVKQSYLKMIDATDEMVKAHYNESVGDTQTNIHNWPIKNLSELGEYTIGLTYKPDDVKEDGTIVLRSGNIKDSCINLEDIVRVNTNIKDSLFVKEGDILMCSRNGSAALVGKVAQIKEIKEPMTFGAFMTIIRSTYTDYLFLFFQSDDFRKQISGGKSSTMNQITQYMLDGIVVPFADDESRARLSRILQQADKSKAELRKSIDAIDKVIKSLINENL